MRAYQLGPVARRLCACDVDRKAGSVTGEDSGSTSYLVVADGTEGTNVPRRGRCRGCRVTRRLDAPASPAGFGDHYFGSVGAGAACRRRWDRERVHLGLRAALGCL